MKAFLLILCQVVCGLAAARAAEDKPPTVTQKLAGLLTAAGQDGKPVISSEQRAYFDSLNGLIKGLLSNVVEREIITKPDHLASVLALGLQPQKMELLLLDNCVLCHTDPEVQKPGSLFSLSPAAGPPAPRLSLRDMVEDVHFRRGVSCAGCHGGDPANDKLEHSFVPEWPGTGRDKNRAWIAAFCARCHSDPTLMNRFNPALPTDQLSKFKASPHGKLLLEGNDPRAPQCVSCHGVHGIRNSKNPFSLVHRKRVPETCAVCHADAKTMAGFKRPDGSPMPTNQLAEYRGSVHGRALLERGDLGAPACNNCHGNHSAMPVGLSSVSQSCGLCHAGNASLFDGSNHKLAFEKHQWPQCGQCHGSHGIAKPHDLLLSPRPDSLCTRCHNEFAKEKPECNGTAAFFYSSITNLDRSWSAIGATVEQLAAKGLDVDPMHDQLNELADSLKQARTHIHSFNKVSFQRVADPGEKAIQTVSSLIQDARREYRVRQTGLVASIALLGLLMLALYLKLRSLEQ